MYKTIKELVNQKASDTIHILGSSESINDITDEQWKEILSVDTYALNNWIYHPTIVPKFYTLELKRYDQSIVKRRFIEKWDRYKDVNYVLMRDQKGIQHLVDAIGHKKEAKVYEISCKERGIHPGEESKNVAVYARTKKVKFDPKTYDANYKPGRLPLVKSYSASITTSIDLIYLMGYNKVVFHGHDYYHSRYFWFNGDKKYGEVHCRSNKDHENKNPAEPHNTLHVMNFITDFNNRHMIPKGREMFIGSTKSLLYPHLRYYWE